MMRARQYGSIATFVITAAVLAIAVISVVAIVQQRGIQARRDQAIAVANQEAKQAKTNQSGSPHTTASTNTTTTPAKTPTQTPPQPTNPTVATTSSALPVTGPELTIVDILPIALIVGFVVAYVSSLASRRQARSL